MPHPEKQRKRWFWALAASLLITLPWLAASARLAVRSGGDSDAWRQWTVSQYVHHGINPYQVSLDILRLNFGPMRGEHRLRLHEFKIYEVHSNMRTEGVAGHLPQYGSPTATYPPSSLFLIAYTMGWLPAYSVHAVWLAVNLLALFLLARATGDFILPGWTPDRRLIASLALFLVWPPTHEVFRTCQFVFLVMLWLVAAFRNMDEHPWKAGVYFTLALIKPSLTLPFLILPVVKGRWKPVALAAGLHVLLMLAMWAVVRVPPWIMISQWLQIPGYMLQGAYTVQEIINRLGFDNTLAGTLTTFGFLGAAGLWALLNRRAGNDAHIAFLCMISVLWTYHERYDFTLLLLPALFFIRDAASADGRIRARMLARTAAFGLLGLALTDYIYGTDLSWCHAVRWLGRGSLLVLFVDQVAALSQRRREGFALSSETGGPSR